MEKTLDIRGTTVATASNVISEDSRISLTYISLAFVAIILGGLFGLLQTLNRAGLLELPSWLNYYQILTAHGVLLVLVFSVLFVFGYFYAVLSRTLDGLVPAARKLGWTALGIMLVGVGFIATMIFFR